MLLLAVSWHTDQCEKEGEVKDIFHVGLPQPTTEDKGRISAFLESEDG